MGDLYGLVVCQADKRVICSPFARLGKINPFRKSSRGKCLEGNAYIRKCNTGCTVEATLKAVAVCDFDVQLWNIGGACINSHTHNTSTKICPPVLSLTESDRWLEDTEKQSLVKKYKCRKVK